MSESGSKVISRPPGRVSRPVSRTRATSGSAATGSTVSGCSPLSPSTTALTLPWPCPVAPSEPNSSTRSPAAAIPSAASDSANMPAARIGPTVWELDGPMPILNRSNALIAMARLLSFALRHGSAAHPFPGWVERRAQRDRHGADLTAHVDLVGTGADEVRRDRVTGRIPDIGQAGRRTEGFPPGGRGNQARGQSIPQHKLAAPHHRVRVIGNQGDQPAPRPLRPGFLDRFPAKKAYVGAELAREPEPGLDRPVVGGQLPPVGPVALLQAHRLDGVVAGVDQPEPAPGAGQQLEHA